MQFRVLGPLEVDAGDGPVPLGGPKQRTVLANLLVRPNEVVPADVLIDEIWGDEPPGQARNTLQTYVSSLRKCLGDGILLGRDPGYVLVVDPIDIDATRFGSLLLEARKAAPLDPRIAIDTLDDALAMWRGPALADVAERSLLAEAARLDELRLEAQEERIGALLAIGDQARAITDLEPLVTRHPLRERLWEQLMIALYRDGRQAEALGAFQRAREVLADELGIDPSPELVRLQGRILAQDATLELRGEPLRGYRLLEKIGTSQVGVRFRAIQPRVERDVEIEIVHEHLAATEAFAERFEPEARAVASLEHPHIAPVYDYWREPGRAYVVSRFFRGPSLAQMLDQGPLEPDRVLAVLEQVASALVFAHRHGVAHGALEAACVRSDTDGNAYLGAFAIGVGPVASVEGDLRAFDALIRHVLGDELPAPLKALLDGAPSPSREATAYLDALLEILGADRTTGARLDPTVPNPYLGLRPFTEQDAPDFFGRSATVDGSIGSLRDARSGRFLAIVGPSGCGKSSLVGAGLIPAIRAGALGDGPVLVATLTPGDRPFDELGSAIRSIGLRDVRRLDAVVRATSRGLLDAVERAIPGRSRVVLVVDQFEELFTLTANEAERASFLECIRVACAEPGGRITVLATLRADFYDRPLAYARFGEMLAAHTFAIAPLQADELEQAIAAPAARAGVPLEPGLVGEIVADAAHQPGALPLVEFAMTQLFDRRTDAGLTLATYRDLGGIVGTIATSAEEALRQAPPGEQRATRQVLLRLVALGEGQADTRRRVPRSELDRLDLDPASVDALLERFGRLRLLTFDRDPATREPTVEIAHEALLTAWPRLRTWIDEARDDLREERVLGRAAQEWLAGGQDPSFLLRGARLEQAASWVERTDLAPSLDVRRYLRTSLEERDREASEAARRLAHEEAVERRSTRRLRALVAVFAAAALVAGSLTLVATDQRRRASEAGEIATARELAAAAVANLEEDPERAVLLAIEAVERSRAALGDALPEAEEALHRAIASSRIVATIPGLGGQVAASGDGLIAATNIDEPGQVTLVDGSGRTIETLRVGDRPLDDLALSENGRFLVTIGADGSLAAWDLRRDRRLWRFRPTADRAEDPHRISLDANATVLVAAWPKARRVLLMDARTGHLVRRFRCVADACQGSVSPDGAFMALAASAKRPHGVREGWIAPMSDLERRTPFAAPPWVGINGPLTWSPNDRFLSGSSFVWDARNGRLLHTAEHGVIVTSSAWSADGALATGSGATARVWDVGSTDLRPRTILSAQGSAGELTDLAFTTNGERLVTASSDAIRLWDVRPLGNEERASLSLPTQYTFGVAFTPGGDLVARFDLTGGDTPSLVRWDPYGSDVRALGGLAASFDVNPVDDSVVIVDPHGPITIVHADTARQVLSATRYAAWAPDGSHLITVSADASSVALVALDGTESWRTRLPIPVGGLWVASDGRIAVTGDEYSQDDRVFLLDGADGRIRSTITTPTNVVDLEFGSTTAGSVVTRGGGGGPMQLWDTRSGELLGTFPAIPAADPDLAISPDGSMLAAIGDDQVVRVYDTATRLLRMTLPAPDALLGDVPAQIHGDPRCYAHSVAFSADGSVLAAQGCAGVRLFDLDVDDLLATARRNVTRPLTDEECRTYLHSEGCPR